MTKNQQAIMSHLRKSGGDIRNYTGWGHAANSWAIQMEALVRKGLVTREVRREDGGPVAFYHPTA